MAKYTYTSDTSRFAHLWEEGYDFKTFQYIKEGWRLYRKRGILYSGYSIAAGIIMLMGIGVSGIIPVLGNIASIALILSLVAGFYIAGHNFMKGRWINLDDLFRGFAHFKQFLLVSLIYVGLSLLASVPMIVLGFGESLLDDLDPASWSVLPSFGLGFIWFLLSAILYLYVFLAYSFAIPAIALAHIRAWPAMEASRKIITKRIFHLLGLYLMLSVLVITVVALLYFLATNTDLEILSMILGAVFAVIYIPFQSLVIFAAYEDIMGSIVVDPLEQKIEEFGADLKKEEDFEEDIF